MNDADLLIKSRKRDQFMSNAHETMRERSIRQAQEESERPGKSPDVQKQQRRYDIANEEFDEQQSYNDAGKRDNQTAYDTLSSVRKTLHMPQMDADTAKEILEG